VTLRYVFSTLSGFGFFLFPLLTMGLFAQERSEGTIEVLLTAPVSEASVALAKFLATVAFYVVMLVPSVVYAAIIVYLGEEIGKPDVGPLLTSYLGLLLAGGLYISIGLFTSALTSSQILAALLSWVVILVFWISNQLPALFGLRNTPAGDALEYLHPLEGHLFHFLRGVIDPADVVYFLSFTALFLFLAVRAIESRKWR
jgi:ABC-2 type transport system permease protein